MAEDQPPAEAPKVRKDLNASEYLAKSLKVAEDFVVNANGYIDLVNSTPRPDKIAVGDFFLTLDGSLVQVIREIRPNPTQCPSCGGQQAPGGIMGLFIGMTQQGMFARPASEEEAGAGDEAGDDEQACEHKPDDKDNPLKGYVCSIIKGGHGYKDLYGEKPGEKYGVDPTGLAIIPNADPEDRGVIVSYQIRLVGLTLKKRMRATFVSAEAATTEHPEVRQQHVMPPAEQRPVESESLTTAKDRNPNPNA